MDDRIRISDADRDRVTERLRDHFAEGRLTSEELDERVTATLNAKTVGELRKVLADLPEPVTVTGPAVGFASQVRRPAMLVRRGPRLLPLAMIALIAAVVLPGAGWVLLAFFKVLLVFWLAACVAGIIMASRFRRRMRRNWQPGYRHDWHQSQWRWR